MDAAGLLVSAAIAALFAPGALRAFTEAGWDRPNFRGERLPFPAGVVAVLAGILALGLCVAVDRDYPADTAALVVGVAFLGLLDDLFDGPPRGWRGHVGAVLRGGFSTGIVKAVGTLALAVAVLGGRLHGHDFPPAVLLVVLATNFFNLLDLRPGRSAKAFWILAVVVLLVSWDSEPLRPLGPFAGAFLVLGFLDLRERCMLGDTGSNVLGVLAGLWLVSVLDWKGEWIAVAVLLALTIFGEFRSFSRTIDRVPPLRVLDSLGRRSDA